MRVTTSAKWTDFVTFALNKPLYQGFFLVVLEKTQGEKNSNSRNFSQKLKQKTQEIGKFNPKIVKNPSIFFEKLTFSSKNSHFFEKLEDFWKTQAIFFQKTQGIGKYTCSYLRKND